LYIGELTAPGIRVCWPGKPEPKKTRGLFWPDDGWGRSNRSRLNL
jgi:hypothetical protein